MLYLGLQDRIVVNNNRCFSQSLKPKTYGVLEWHNDLGTAYKFI